MVNVEKMADMHKDQVGFNMKNDTNWLASLLDPLLFACAGGI